MHDFDREVKAARQLKEILDREAGVAENDHILAQVNSVVTKNFYELPQRVLDGIFEKLEILKSAGLDTTRQKEIHKQYVDQWAKVKKKLTAPEEPNPDANQIEQMLDVLSEFFYMLAFIDYLKGEVDSMCHNYIMMMDKLAP